MLRGILVGLAIAALVPACKKTSCKDADMDRDTVLRLQKTVAQGKDPCPELLTPQIVVDGHGVALDGAILAKPSELPTNRLERVDALFDKLKSLRENWLVIHPGETFRPTARFTIAPDVEAFAGASVIVTAAFAGYPRFHVQSGDVTLDGDYHVPPRPDAPDDQDVALEPPKGTFHDTLKALAVAAAKPAASGKKRVVSFAPY